MYCAKLILIFFNEVIFCSIATTSALSEFGKLSRVNSVKLELDPNVNSSSSGKIALMVPNVLAARKHKFFIIF